MVKSKSFVVVDVGSSKIASTVVTLDRNKKHITNPVFQKSRGFSYGKIVDLQNFTQSFNENIERSERMLKRHVNFGILGVNGSKVVSQSHTVEVVLDRGIVQACDIDRLKEKAVLAVQRDCLLPLHVIIQAYFLDGEDKIKNPLEMAGKNLTAKTLVLCAERKSLAHLSQAAEKAKLDVKGYLVAPYVAHFNVLTAEDKDISVLLIDIGSDTTSISFYMRGKLMFLQTLIWGGVFVTQALARGLHLSFERAEMIKISEGVCLRNYYAQEHRLANKKTALEPLAKERLIDLILPEINVFISHLKKILIERQIKDIQKILFIGGGARLNGIQTYILQCLNHPIFDSKIAEKNLYHHAVDFSTLSGMTTYFCQRSYRQGVKDLSYASSLVQKMGSWLKKNL